MLRTRPVLPAALGLVVAACGSAPVASEAPATPASAPASPAPPAPVADVGPKPELTAAPAFTPPTPQVVSIPGLPQVWLVERHALPMVALQIVVPAGGADDPAGKSGLAALTAEMMEQGAGRYGALEISRLFDQLGAVASVDAGTDASTASLTVLKPNLKRALELLGDVVARPRFEAAEWTRAQALWLDQLRQRPFEPGDVASLVGRAVHFGAGHPYSHPVDGHVDSIGKLTLADAKAYHKAHWRPDQATLVVVGDVTVDELKTLFVPAFSNWVAPKTPPAARVTAAPPKGPWPRTVLVDRPDAPQTMFLLVAPGPVAADPGLVTLELANIPLGGSFTSRLNTNLREDKGYTYGAKSALSQDRLAGRWSIRTAVESGVTGPALNEILKEIKQLVEGGLKPEELKKARASDRGDLVSGYESLEPIAGRLADIAGLGLPADWDAQRARAADTADDAAIGKAATTTSLRDATIIAVGDGKAIRAAFQAAALPEPEVRDAEGRPVAAPKTKGKAK
jgi:zinc protease